MDPENWWFVDVSFSILTFPGVLSIPSRELTYPTWGKGKSSSSMPCQGDMLISWRVILDHLDDRPSFAQKMQVVRMRGEGMPLRDDPASFGDLHVKAMSDDLRWSFRKQHCQIAPKFAEAFEAWNVNFLVVVSNFFFYKKPENWGR